MPGRQPDRHSYYSVSELGTWGIFLLFQWQKMIFCIFYQINLTGRGLFNRTGAEIDYYLHKKCKKSFFFVEKIKKYLKCPALQNSHIVSRLWSGHTDLFSPRHMSDAASIADVLQLHLWPSHTHTHTHIHTHNTGICFHSSTLSIALQYYWGALRPMSCGFWTSILQQLRAKNIVNNMKLAVAK